MSKDFKSFLKDKDISHQLTIAYTPEQNGVAERKNRILVEMMHSMMSSKKLSPKFWFYVVHTTSHILNRSSSKSLKFIAPYEAYYGKKPNVGYFKVFGSPNYVHIERKDRGKLDIKVIKAVFIGYAIEGKGYKFYVSDTADILLSCIAYISENQIFDKKATLIPITIEYFRISPELGTLAMAGFCRTHTWSGLYRPMSSNNYS
ncbi:hypothetical protein KP509_22G064900 [Ceratopteris richardii]|uniref:Integrase catalytic domain-containing protein n=1 Tax=Ceratopteris richardii TaxID=49495 RepID=A0A8T2S944_CERRI|nr:hypothetical protein KP509_22G064900 [Ceratopteris richardii]